MKPYGLAVAAAAAFVLLDELIKAEALKTFPSDAAIHGTPLFALAVHKNIGVAFDIPFKMPLIYLASIIIATCLIHVITQTYKKKPETALFATLILIGAAGNLYDRVVYGFTVDYFLILKRLAINISDLIILLGVAGILLSGKKSHGHTHSI